MHGSLAKVLFLACLCVVLDQRSAFAQGALTNGGIHLGTIAVAGETDTWTYTAESSGTLIVAVAELVRTPDTGFGPQVRVYNSGGTPVASDAGALTAQAVVNGAAAGTYTVEVTSALSTTVGDYRITVAHVPDDFTISGGDQGGALTSGANHTGRIELGDLDIWTFDRQAGQGFVLSLTEASASGTDDPAFVPWVRVYAPNGAPLTNDAAARTAQVAAGHSLLPLTVSGRYTVIVGTLTASGNAGRDGVSDYVLRLATVPGDFDVPTDDQGGALTSGANHTGRIELGDLDIWTFDRQAGQGFVLSLTEASGTDDPAFVPWVRVYDPNGAPLTNDAAARTAQVAAGHSLLPLTVSGRYTVIVGTYTAAGNAGRDGVSDYVLRLAAVPGSFDVPAGDQGGALANGANHTGRIELGDLDIWTFDRQAGQSFVLSLTEASGTDDPAFVPWVRVYDPNGAPLTNDAAARTAQVAAGHSLLPLTVSGRYTVVVGTYTAAGNAGRDGVSDYVLRLAAVPGSFDVPAGDQGGALANGANHTGRIELGDLDPWTFYGCVGQALNITAEEVAGQPDLGFVPWIRVYDRTGVLVGNNYGNGTVQVPHTPGSSGLFTIVVGTLTASGNSGRDGIGDYTIRVTGACAPPTVPTSVPDSYSTPFNMPLVIAAPGVLANDIGGTSVVIGTTVGQGTLVLNQNGGFTYTPPTGFSGVTHFTYRAVNTAGSGNLATVSITVQPANRPTAANDSYMGTRDQALVVTAPGVLGNDTSNGGGTMTAQLVATVAHGVLALAANGGFTYTPTSGYTGPDSFTYHAVNAAGAGNVATVSLTVHPPGPQPPTNLVAWSVTGNRVTLRWTPPAAGSTPTGYVMDGGIVPGQVLASLPTGSTQPVFSFTAPTGSFYVRVRTLAGAQSSSASNEIRLHVNVPVPPSAPTGLLGTANGSTLALSWRHTFTGGTPSSAILDVSGPITTSLPIGLTESFAFGGVPAGTYTFRVRARNAGGASPASNPVTLTFPIGCTGAPTTPQHFLASKVGNTLTLLWDPPATGGAVSTYVLNVSGTFNLTLPMTGRSIAAAVPPGSYTFTVTAMNACGASSATTPQTIAVP